VVDGARLDRVRLARPAGGYRALEGADGLGDPWYTITDDFDVDFGVDKWHSTNAFFRDGDRIFRTYLPVVEPARRVRAGGLSRQDRGAAALSYKR
jgi:hypothetical protein